MYSQIKKTFRLINDDGKLINKYGKSRKGYCMPLVLDYKLRYYKEGISRDIMLRSALWQTYQMLRDLIEFGSDCEKHLTLGCSWSSLPIPAGTVVARDGNEFDCADMGCAFGFALVALRSRIVDLWAYFQFELTASQKAEMECEFYRLSSVAAGESYEAIMSQTKAFTLYGLVSMALLRKLDALLIPTEEEKNHGWDGFDMMLRLSESIRGMDVAKVCNVIGAILPDGGMAKVELFITDNDFHAVLGMAEPFIWSMVDNRHNN